MVVNCPHHFDTHGKFFDTHHVPQERVNVAIHCGDLTDGSKLEEYRAAIQLLKGINAPLKLVIAGNHDFSLDQAAFNRIKSKANRAYQEALDGSIAAEFRRSKDAKALLLNAKEDGIIYLDKGSHQFILNNGAVLNVYARGTNLVVTHSPPLGIWDRRKDPSEKTKRIRCPQLFQAVAKAQPRIHCFGHVHGD
ncbi:hypothetical protein E4U41_006753 [Claviceps citrina]|nr:hypothetical protein E4U41_006753 [Claviceps citrina]